VLNKQLGAVALLNPQGQHVEIDHVFNDGRFWALVTAKVATVELTTIDAVWANNGDAISRA
jgi:hypothetical protein